VQAALLGRLSRRQVEKAHPARVLLGSALVAFGWAYPHFLPEDPASTYLYAAPLGLIPCPTLSLVLGVTIVFSNLRSRAWSVILACTALFYGALGVGSGRRGYRLARALGAEDGGRRRACRLTLSS
jgi:hypothetical protein